MQNTSAIDVKPRLVLPASLVELETSLSNVDAVRVTGLYRSMEVVDPNAAFATDEFKLACSVYAQDPHETRTPRKSYVLGIDPFSQLDDITAWLP